LDHSVHALTATLTCTEYLTNKFLFIYLTSTQQSHKNIWQQQLGYVL